MNIQEIPLSQIRPPRLQPRLQLDSDAIEELAISIERHGLISPLTVVADDGGYRLLAGNRRYHALQRLAVSLAPCNVVDPDPLLEDEITIAENLLRLNLTPIEEAYAFALYLEQSKDSQDDLARRLGKERTYVTRRLLLLDLDDTTLGALQDGLINLSQALLLRRIADPAIRAKFIEHTEQFGANVRTMTYWVTNYLREEARAQAANEAPTTEATFQSPRQTFMGCDRCTEATAYDLIRPVYLCPKCQKAIQSFHAFQLLEASKKDTL